MIHNSGPKDTYTLIVEEWQLNVAKERMHKINGILKKGNLTNFEEGKEGIREKYATRGDISKVLRKAEGQKGRASPLQETAHAKVGRYR